MTVSNDQNGNVIVNLDGNSQMFAAGTMWTLSYTGGIDGGDKFTNTTGLSQVTVTYGSSNQVTGGTSWNLAYLWGDNNSFNSSGGACEVFTYGSNNNTTPRMPP